MSAAFDPTRDHRITREEAIGLVQTFHAQAGAGAHRASAFNRNAFEQLLAQTGAAGIRIYLARHGDGSPTMVMVAVDVEGKDMVGAQSVYIQNSTDCPPLCFGTTLATPL
jgi:hypothetical protein